MTLSGKILDVIGVKVIVAPVVKKAVQELKKRLINNVPQGKLKMEINNKIYSNGKVELKDVLDEINQAFGDKLI